MALKQELDHSLSTGNVSKEFMPNSRHTCPAVALEGSFGKSLHYHHSQDEPELVTVACHDPKSSKIAGKLSHEKSRVLLMLFGDTNISSLFIGKCDFQPKLQIKVHHSSSTCVKLNQLSMSKKLPYQVISSWLAQMAQGLNYLHNEASFRLGHEEFKSSNVSIKECYGKEIEILDLPYEMFKTVNKRSSERYAWMKQRGFKLCTNSKTDIHSFSLLFWELLNKPNQKVHEWSDACRLIEITLHLPTKHEGCSRLSTLTTKSRKETNHIQSRLYQQPSALLKWKESVDFLRSSKTEFWECRRWSCPVSTNSKQENHQNQSKQLKKQIDCSEKTKLKLHVLENYVHTPSTLEALTYMVQMFFLASSDLFEEVEKTFISVKSLFYAKFKQTCFDIFHFKNTESLYDEYTKKAFVAYHIVDYFSLAQLNTWINGLSRHYTCIDKEVILTCCCLLNPRKNVLKEIFHHSHNDVTSKTKRRVFKKFLDTMFRENYIKADIDVEQLDFLYECSYQLNHDSLVRKIGKLGHKWKRTYEVFSQPIGLDGNLKVDGRLYDRARDPPGQRSVYIPPGDTFKETYRLSTFIKFPQSSPANPRNLAAAGFFYTGFKDRVKCFSCGLCVENWVLGDDVKHSRWHRDDCQMMLGQDSGNVPIGGFFRFSSQGNRSGGQPATEGPRVSGLPAHNMRSIASRQNISTVPAGILLKHTSGSGSSSSFLQQTARPVIAPQQPNQNYPRVEIATITTGTHEQLIRNLDLRKEADRVQSFRVWPQENRTVHPAELAQSGFFYLGNLDRVQCFSCGGVLRNWNYGDNVDMEHRRHFPNCRLMRNQDERNIPLLPSEREAAPPRPSRMQEPPDPNESEQRELLNMFPCLYPVSPHMRNEQSRFETFDSRWPTGQVLATPQQIASAGFFFLGERDRVKCWYCNGGLQNWDIEDEPWTEHAKWFPTCEFLLQRKGPDFVHRMVSLFPSLPRPVLRGPFDVPPSGGRSASRRRQASPPPRIIDPKVEMQRTRARVEEAMTSSIVTSAVNMGFQREVIKRVVKRKLESGGDMFGSVDELLEHLANNPATDPSDDDEEMSDTESVQPTDIKTTGNTEEMSASGAAPRSIAGTSSREESSIAQPMDAEMSLPEDMPPSINARIRELQDERKCKICLDNIADVVFVPCGHLCSCTNCAQALRKCPICRVKIEKAMRTYMS